MNRGHTLIEVAVAASLITVIVLVASSTSGSISDASNYGRHLLQVQSDNQSALYFMANDLQTSSSDSDPVTNEPRYEVLDADFVVEMKSRTAESVTQGDTSEMVLAVITSTQETQTETQTAIASNEPEEGEIFDSRPRDMKVMKNSRFTFRKVTGYEVNSEVGEVKPLWSEPVSYYVERRRLIREQGNQKRVIGTNVSAFKVFAEEKGNFQVFLRTQKRNSATGEVLTASGSIEVNPKNR